jgi:hypothetical protein
MARDTILELFLFVCQKPTMYVQCARFSAVSAFIAGYDAALEGGALIGFREWLLTGNKDWTNLPWWSLVRLRLDSKADLSSPPRESEDEALIAELHTALEGFSRIQKDGGLAKIFHDYNTWVLSQTDPAIKALQDRLRVALPTGPTPK